jgi:hypothetical protein
MANGEVSYACACVWWFGEILCVVFFFFGWQWLAFGVGGFPSACWTPPPFLVLVLVTYQILVPLRFFGDRMEAFWALLDAGLVFARYLFAFSLHK